MMFVLYRLKLPDPYVGPGGVDFICSKPGHEGMTHCATEIPIWIENGVPCNGSYSSSSADGPTSCVNWNQYYTVCKTGLSNPYRGSISFDNIGLAWVAIFQVVAFFRHRWSRILCLCQHVVWPKIIIKLFFRLFLKICKCMCDAFLILVTKYLKYCWLTQRHQALCNGAFWINLGVLIFQLFKWKS